ncbi:MAG: hypothetical protein ACJ8R9_27530 [Steroidobacteraceae bacterium]
MIRQSNGNVARPFAKEKRYRASGAVPGQGSGTGAERAITVAGAMHLNGIEMLHWICRAMLAVAFLCATCPTLAREVAPTPRMGWNSWDSYGLTIDETDFKPNARELAKLRSHGWTYALIDAGWYMGNPFGDKLQNRQYLLDSMGC